MRPDVARPSRSPSRRALTPRQGRVVAARRRSDGAPVYSGADGWVENLRVATVERSELGLRRRVANAELDVELGRVVDVHAIEVEDFGLGPRPVRLRDRLRLQPSTGSDELRSERVLSVDF